MTDRYAQLVNTPIGKLVTKQVGLPQPSRLERYEAGGPVIAGPVLLGGAGGAGSGPSRLSAPVAKILKAIDADVLTAMDEELRTAAAEAKLDAGVFNPEAASGDRRFKALVFDATQIESSDELDRAWAFFAPAIRRLEPSGRVIILATPPEDCATAPLAVAQRALEGLERAIGKELKRGATSQLIYVKPKAEAQLESTLRFLLSPRSAFVSGQVVRIGSAAAGAGKVDWDAPLAGKVVLVTGAARGIGAAIAEVLARDGAHVVGLDVPQMAEELSAVTGGLGGSLLTADITDADAPSAIADHLVDRHDGVDVVVHNAGITRDKTLGRMTQEQWSKVIAINLTAPQRITEELLARDAVRRNGRIIGVSSISGIAGNAGQTNYSTSKAGVIGFVQAYAPALGKRGVTINAVAPGFIETQMTAAMPIAIREAGRRMNSVSQGGLPVDVAETVAWFASPGSAGVTGNIVRVCGQSLIGA
ncbi:MAG TPA: 3-oxoacyl-ACP reductase [Solirubrobacteraceae bacterium]|jgi:3-oxoacyl-[acyl-carrier protein] reductase|nr:3-oxoacyl-ACP reductase [Solirubrobacteraceae bacterium]